jgi:SAM-dependent methyltransferase/O-antigen/teichoic acid export membrane protein
MPEPGSVSQSHKFLTLMGGRFTRDTAIYIVGALAVGPFSLVSVMVLTRIMTPAEYGELALLFFFSGYLTILYNTGSLHGTFMLVYGASTGEGDDVESDARLSATPARALATGMALTLIIVSAGTFVCFLFAPSLSQVLLNRRSGATLICWAAASAGAGALWRLSVNVFRMERQPGRFAAFNAVRPLFVVAGTVPLVALGFGVQGALAGTALGTLGAVAVCIAMARSSYSLAFSLADAREIVRRGSMVVVPVVALFLVHSIDVVLLSRFAPTHEVGLYRVASRFAAVPSYFASAFLMAWAPLERGVLFQATYRHVGEDRVRGAILTYYLLGGMTIVLLLDIAAPGLMLLVGPGYRSAAPLIPLVGVGFVCYGLYMVLVRVVKVERRMLFYGAGAVLAVLLDVGLSSMTIPWLGAYGVPLGVIGGVLMSCLLWILAVRGLMKASISFQARPLIGLAVAVALASAIQGVGAHVWPSGRAVVLALVVVSYFGAVIGLGVVPPRHLRLLARFARAAVRRGMSTVDPARGLEQLTPARRNVLAALERDGLPSDVLAGRLGWSERKVQSEYLAALRQLLGIGTPPAEALAFDPGVAGYLLSTLTLARRDLVGRGLVEEGVDALELMELDETAKRLRALAAEEWPAQTGRVSSTALNPGMEESRSRLLAPWRRLWRKLSPGGASPGGEVGGLNPGGTRAQAKTEALMPPGFAALAHELRDEIIEHYERRGKRLDTPAGLRTLDTNSVLAAGRGRLLLRLLAEQGMGSISGLRVLDLGAGFGALALYFAHLGAHVVAVDPNEQRARVALAIARRRGLDLSVVGAGAQSLPFPDASFDLVVANNSLCYIVGRDDRRTALSEIHRVLRPGGWVAVRNPNRLHPRDQFTGLPLLGLLPARLAQRATRALGRPRPEIRMHSPRGAARQLRGVGFTHARWRPHPGPGPHGRFAGYHHVLARRAEEPATRPRKWGALVAGRSLGTLQARGSE